VNRELNAHEKQALLAIARQAIVHGVQTGQEYIEPREEKALNQRNGCFVTIKQDRQLRGCIGNFQSELPLFKEVAQMAQASASKDPRFYPLKEEDLTNFNLEISVLSPLRKIENIEEIEVGTHGIYIEKSFYRGVLLPQVKPASRQDCPQMRGKLKMPRSTFSAPRSLAKTLQNKPSRQ
jgi:AmmeMemoRadiSam system protein A